MSAEVLWSHAAWAKFEEYTNTALFIKNADVFCRSHNVPKSVNELLFKAFFVADFNNVLLLVKQLMEIMSEYESAAVALRFGNGLPPKLVLELRQQIDGIKEGAYRWAEESCTKLGLGGIENALNDAKKWFEWLAVQPNKSAIELECQGLVEMMKAIPADNYNWS